MASTTIPQLPYLTAIGGLEQLEVVLNGTSYRINTAQIFNLVGPGTFPLSIAVGGTGATNAAGARANLGLGTIAVQNANAVAITGGTISGIALTLDSLDSTPIGATTPSTGVFTTVGVTAPIASASATGALSYGSLPYSDVNIFADFAGNVNSYAQVVLSNINSGATASTDFIVGNNQSTATTNYGDFGINSSGFTGTGALNQPGSVFLAATTADLAIGTTTSNAIHFVVNNGAADAMTISTAGVVSLGTALAVGSGGIGTNTLTSHGVVYGNGTSALGATAEGATGQVLIGNTGAAPSWSALTSLGVTSLNFGTTGLTPATATTGTITVGGTLNVANGGTGRGTFTANGLIYGNTTTGLLVTAAGTTGQFLIGNTGAAPTWGTLSTSAVTSITFGTSGLTPSTATTGAVTVGGTLIVGNGGTGAATFTANGVLYGNATGALQVTALGASGSVLTGTGGAPAFAALSGLAVTSLNFGTTGLTPSTATNGVITVAGTLNAVNGGTGNATYAVGDLLYASTTTALTRLPAATTGFVLTQGGTTPTWAQLSYPSPVRQTVLSGPQTAGLPTFFPATSVSLTLTAQNISTGANALIFSSAGGFSVNGAVDVTGILTSNPSWVGTASSTNYAGLTVASGTGTAFVTTLQPIYQYGGTISVTSGQYTFDITQMKMFLGNGTTAPQVNAVFVGEFVTSGTAVTSAVNYAYQGTYDSGYINPLPSAGTNTLKNSNIGVTIGLNILVTLQNLTAEGNYSVGDILNTISVSNGSGLVPPLPVGSTRLTVWIVSGSTTAWSSSNKTTGVNIALTLANWAYRIYVKRAW